MQEMLSVQIPRFTIAVLLVLIMLILVRSFEGFFFVKGKLDAEAAPIPLIIDKPSSWRILGPAIAGAMCLGLTVFVLAFGNLPTLLQTTLSMAGTRAILGNDIFKYFSISFELPDSRIVLRSVGD